MQTVQCCSLETITWEGFGIYQLLPCLFSDLCERYIAQLKAHLCSVLNIYMHMDGAFCHTLHSLFVFLHIL